MRDIKMVIGLNFGDEGKGLMTDYFTSQHRPGLVVRFNGGAQAGHTVQLEDGTRHVFGHFGAGTLNKWDTYLSSFFVTLPKVFRKELEEIKKIAFDTDVYVHKNCMVTTPYDILLNQIIEEARGARRHGSCGMGFNETITRNESGLRLCVQDLLDLSKTDKILNAIRNTYFPERLKELDISIPPKFIDAIMNLDDIDREFIRDAKFMMDNVEIANDQILGDYESIVFEGAQGLLLDQNNTSYFPHVTRSNTGCINAAEILKDSNILGDPYNLEVCYVTRCYLTRHGNGYLPSEVATPATFLNLVDETNVPNEFQGALRIGLLDSNIQYRAIWDFILFARRPLPELSLLALARVKGGDEWHGLFESCGILFSSAV